MPFFTGLVIVGPVTITLWIMWGVIHWIDAWIKPLLPTSFNPDTYLPFPVPGLGLVVAIVGLTVIGALAANLLGRALVSSSELMMSRTPIVRNVYGAIKQIFESVISATGPNQSFQKVGMIEFPSKGIWSLVFVTGETAGEIKDVKPGGESDLLTVFMPTGHRAADRLHLLRAAIERRIPVDVGRRSGQDRSLRRHRDARCAREDEASRGPLRDGIPLPLGPRQADELGRAKQAHRFIAFEEVEQRAQRLAAR